jgi:hypothetical protein
VTGAERGGKLRRRDFFADMRGSIHGGVDALGLVCRSLDCICRKTQNKNIGRMGWLSSMKSEKMYIRAIFNVRAKYLKFIDWQGAVSNSFSFAV